MNRFKAYFSEDILTLWCGESRSQVSLLSIWNDLLSGESGRNNFKKLASEGKRER